MSSRLGKARAVLGAGLFHALAACSSNRALITLAFFAGGRGLVAGNFDGQGYSVSVWEVATGKELGPLSLLASGATGGARVTTRGDILIDYARLDTNLAIHESVEGWVHVADITTEGRFILNGPGWANINNLQSDGVPLPTFEGGESAIFVSMSPDGSKVFGYVNQEPRVWDLTTGKRLFP